MGSPLREDCLHLWTNYLVWEIFNCHYMVIQDLKLIVIGVAVRLILLWTWKILDATHRFTVTRSFLMAAVCSVGTTVFDMKGFKQKFTSFTHVVAFLLNRNHNFFSVDCLAVILQSFNWGGGEMGKEGTGIFHWDVHAVAAFLAGLLDAVVFFC